MNRLYGLRRRTARAMVTLFLMAGAATALSACNTVAGAGKDTSATGHVVTKTADQVKQGL